MDFSIVPNLEHRHQADILVIPLWMDAKKAVLAAPCEKLKAVIQPAIDSGDFKGKEGEVQILYLSKQPETRVALLGLGNKEKITTEKLRRAYSNLVKSCLSRKLKKINILIPEINSLSEESVARGISEGILLSNYVYDKNRHDLLKESPTVLLEKVSFIGSTHKDFLDAAKKALLICKGVYFARDLSNGNADLVTPEYLVETAKTLGKQHKSIKVKILDKKQLIKEKMGLILAVNRGANHNPALIIMEYNGDPRSKERTIVVGKGVTFDTGGLNLKPTGSMETMKADMSGAATGFGTILSAALLKLKVNLTVVVPTVENSMGPDSYKPGDVYKSYAGKTVEVGNTDAEGRLILADALAYSVKHLKPTRIIDFATLTGAMEIALGNETIGLMSNDDALSDALILAGSETFERAWRLPLYEEYRELLKSDTADIKNIGGRGAGSITAALFLQEFVGKTPWAHFDIAGTAFLSKAIRY